MRKLNDQVLKEHGFRMLMTTDEAKFYHYNNIWIEQVYGDKYKIRGSEVVMETEKDLLKQIL